MSILKKMLKLGFTKKGVVLKNSVIFLELFDSVHAYI